jgi:hypothetical protein
LIKGSSLHIAGNVAEVHAVPDDHFPVANRVHEFPSEAGLRFLEDLRISWREGHHSGLSEARPGSGGPAAQRGAFSRSN